MVVSIEGDGVFDRVKMVSIEGEGGVRVGMVKPPLKPSIGATIALYWSHHHQTITTLYWSHHHSSIGATITPLLEHHNPSIEPIYWSHHHPSIEPITY